MKLSLACRMPFVLALSAVALLAQQPEKTATPADPPAIFGQVTGHVTCSDTGQAARFAGVQLVSSQPAKSPFDDLKKLGKDGDLSKLMAVSMKAMLSSKGLTAMTDMDGNFTLRQVPPGDYYLLAQAPGYLSAISLYSQQERMQNDKDALAAVIASSPKITVSASSTAHADATLTRGGALSGTVRYDDGTPAPSVNPILMLQGKDGKWKDLNIGGMLPAITNDKGEFRLFGIPAGKYAVRAALPTTQATMGLGSGSLNFEIKPGDALIVYNDGQLRESAIKPIELGEGEDRGGIDLVFPISGLYAVSGTLTAKSDSHAINFGSVGLEDPVTKAKLRTTLVDPDGSFRFNNVPEGEYLLAVEIAADTVQKKAGQQDTDALSRLMNSTPTKKYEDLSQTITVKGETVGLNLQLTEKPDSKKSAEKAEDGDQ